MSTLRDSIQGDTLWPPSSVWPNPKHFAAQEKPQGNSYSVLPFTCRLKARKTNTALFEGYIRAKKNKAKGGTQNSRKQVPLARGRGWNSACRGFQVPGKVLFLKPGVLNIGVQFIICKSCLQMYFI